MVCKERYTGQYLGNTYLVPIQYLSSTYLVTILYLTYAKFLIQTEDYHRNELNGNACRDVLEALEELEAELVSQNLPNIAEITLLLRSLRAFNKVRTSCFGEDLETSYKDDINEFREEHMIEDDKPLSSSDDEYDIP